MDIEGLSKTQMVLLTLLVSFVTSIATGIATVSLYDQAPSKVTRVVNRVVERSVETVSQASPSVVTKEETVVVRDDELITESIASVSQGVIRIIEDGSSIGVGVALLDGVGVTNSALVHAVGGKITIRGQSGDSVSSEVLGRSSEGNWTFFEIPKTLGLSPIALGAAQNLAIGNTVIAVGGTKQARAETGIVTQIDTAPAEAEGENTVTAFYTSVPQATLTPGTPVTNIFGEIVGIAGGDQSGAVVPVGVVRSEYEASSQ